MLSPVYSHLFFALVVRAQHIVNSCSSEKAQDIVNIFSAARSGFRALHAISQRETAWTTAMICADDVRQSVYG